MIGTYLEHTASIYPCFDAPVIRVVVSAPEPTEISGLYSYTIGDINESCNLNIEAELVLSVREYTICPEILSRHIEVPLVCRTSYLVSDEEWEWKPLSVESDQIYDHLSMMGERTKAVSHKNNILHYVHFDDVNEEPLVRDLKEKCRILDYPYPFTGFEFVVA